MTKTKPVLISIVGPTAVGKTKMAIEIAKEFQTEIISADSRQFYRELTIGTAKPNKEELEQAKHHFINSHSIKELYSAGQYDRDVEILLKKLFSKHKLVVAVGGSSLYLKALWEGFDEIPEVDKEIRNELNQKLIEDGLGSLLEELKQMDPVYFNEVDKNNGQRVVRALEVIRGTEKPFSSFRKSEVKESFYRNVKIGLDMDRSELFKKIDFRMDLMIRDGLFEEVESLYEFKDHNALQTVGYSEIFRHIEGKYDRKEAIRLLKRNSRRYAKRQMTWFRRYTDIDWYNPSQQKEIFEVVKSILS